MLNAPLLGLEELVSVSIPGNEVVKKSKYSFAILLNFCQEVQCSITTLTNFLIEALPPSSPVLLFFAGGALDSDLLASSGLSSTTLLLPVTRPRAIVRVYKTRLISEREKKLSTKCIIVAIYLLFLT